MLIVIRKLLCLTTLNKKQNKIAETKRNRKTDFLVTESEESKDGFVVIHKSSQDLTTNNNPKSISDKHNNGKLDIKSEIKIHKEEPLNDSDFVKIEKSPLQISSKLDEISRRKYKISRKKYNKSRKKYYKSEGKRNENEPY